MGPLLERKFRPVGSDGRAFHHPVPRKRAPRPIFSSPRPLPARPRTHPGPRQSRLPPPERPPPRAASFSSLSRADRRRPAGPPPHPRRAFSSLAECAPRGRPLPPPCFAGRAGSAAAVRPPAALSAAPPVSIRAGRDGSVLPAGILPCRPGHIRSPRRGAPRRRERIRRCAGVERALAWRARRTQFVAALGVVGARAGGHAAVAVVANAAWRARWPRGQRRSRGSATRAGERGGGSGRPGRAGRGPFYFPPWMLAREFVDTEEFQRLRDLKQLGLTYLVFPGAVHTRFEHSLGVYRLAGEAMNNLQKYQGKELGIDRVDAQTVKLAGLLHDIGHGPFSHLFEHEFLPRIHPGSTWSHEHMSALLLDSIVDKHAIDIEPDYLKAIKEMIVASSDFSTTEKSSKVLLKEEDVAVSNVKIDLTRGKDNPLESIKFFKDFGCEEKFPITDERVSHLLPVCNQDRIVRVYAKKPELVEAVSEAFENLQLRMYGEKTQVHDTPTKKKRRFN